MGFFDFLFPPRSDESALRSVTADEFLGKMRPTLVPETAPETAVLFSFGDPVVRAAIHEAKYHGSEHAFTLLGLALAEYLREGEDTRLGAVRIVPVPLSRHRQRERRFNQVREVALRAGADVDIKLDETLLLRTRDTKTQTSLSRREREENMRGAFRAAHSADPACTYIVVDDVLTTGATLQAAIAALREAGALHIAPLAFAH